MISFIFPVYNDEEVLQELYKRLKPVISIIDSEYEIIFVDDGSTDNTFDVLTMLKQIDKSIIIIKFTRNFGQSAAIAAGLANSIGDKVVIMDADLQDKPEDIPKLLKALEFNNSDMAVAHWIERKGSRINNFLSNLFYGLSARITSLKHKPNLGNFRVATRKVVNAFLELGESTTTSVSLLYWMGFNYVTVDLKRDSRNSGKSGYNFRKKFNMALSRILSYSNFPIKAIFAFSFMFFIAFLILFVLIIFQSTLFNISRNTLLIIMILMMISSVHLFAIGFIGEYLWRTFLEAKRRPKYIIDKII